MMQIALLIVILIALIPLRAHGQMVAQVGYLSSADDSQQLAMFYAPTTGEPVPLVVALHTWSGNYEQDTHKAIEEWCVKKGWEYIHPDFRGPNRRPEATGSPMVVQDIISAVDYARTRAKIDTSSIYLVGTSGGGYTALVMAGHHPDMWAGVSAWVPVSDLRAWYDECKMAKRDYFLDIAASCGGAPGDNPAVDKEYKDRSPLTYLANAKNVNLHINAGIYDGHKGSVPISHSLLAFNEVAETADRISLEDITFLVEKAQVPEHLVKPIDDPDYGEKAPLFRRTSGKATVTIFRGGHTLIPEAAIGWIRSLERNKLDE